MKTERVGRDGYIGLVFEWRGGRTVLTSRRCSAPLQVLEPIDLPGGALGVMLLNNGGGMVGGDRALVEITLGAGARTIVTTPQRAESIVRGASLRGIRLTSQWAPTALWITHPTI